MRKETTYIDQAKFESIVRESGLQSKEQAGFVKVSAAKGRNVYVARTKRVGRVDLSGFEMPKGTAGIIDLGGESFGAVSQQLDFGRPEEDILSTFRAVLTHMATLPAREREKPTMVARPPKAKDGEAAKKGPEEEAKRLALIERVAKEKGVGVSKKAKAPKAEAPKTDAPATASSQG